MATPRSNPIQAEADFVGAQFLHRAAIFLSPTNTFLSDLWRGMSILPIRQTHRTEATKNSRSQILRSQQGMATANVDANLCDRRVFVALLRDLVDHASGELFPIDVSLNHADQFDAGATKRRDLFTSFDRVETTKAIFVPTKDRVEVPAFGGVRNYLQELLSLASLRSANGVVLIPANDVKAMLVGELHYFGALLGWAFLLFVRRHADVADGGFGSGFALVHRSPPLSRSMR